MFGGTVKEDGAAYVTELEDDLLAVPDSRMNATFGVVDVRTNGEHVLVATHSTRRQEGGVRLPRRRERRRGHLRGAGGGASCRTAVRGAR